MGPCHAEHRPQSLGGAGGEQGGTGKGLVGGGGGGGGRDRGEIERHEIVWEALVDDR